MITYFTDDTADKLREFGRARVVHYIGAQGPGPRGRVKFDAYSRGRNFMKKQTNKCSYSIIQVCLPNFKKIMTNRPTDQPTERPTDGHEGP